MRGCYRVLCHGTILVWIMSLLTALSAGCAPEENQTLRVTPIPDIQGEGLASPLEGQLVTVEGVVTGDFQEDAELKGFFLQDPVGDGRTQTSDAVFVSSPLSERVNVGDVLQAKGRVAELDGLTSIKGTTARDPLLTVMRTGEPVEPIRLTLPLKDSESWESYEGMLVKFPQTLTVADTYHLGDWGEVILSAGGRLFTPTNTLDVNDSPASGTSVEGASNRDAVLQRDKTNERLSLLLDDGSRLEAPRPVPHVDRRPSHPSTLRLGSTLETLTGVVSHRYAKYRVHPTVPPAFNYASRPKAPALPRDTRVSVAVMNVQNYFTTIADGTNDARGARSGEELQRQEAKLTAALKALDAAVVGLVELENRREATAQLLKGLNQHLGDAKYRAVEDPPGLAQVPGGNDAIKVGIVFKPSMVTPVGRAVTISDPAFRRARAPVAQAFETVTDGEMFSVIVCHFKSKRPDGAQGRDRDQGDGQGAYNAARRRQSRAVLRLASRISKQSGDPDVLIIGDLNAYAQEDPVDLLRSGGYVDLVKAFAQDEPYTYVYKGEIGQLDYAFASPSLAPQVLAAHVWHINADEPRTLGYRKTSRTDSALYQPGPFRSSDHDPIIVALEPGR